MLWSQKNYKFCTPPRDLYQAPPKNAKKCHVILHEIKPAFKGQRKTKMSFDTLEARIEHTEKAAARISGKLLELEQHVVGKLFILFVVF